jgi:hypothetical protein
MIMELRSESRIEICKFVSLCPGPSARQSSVMVSLAFLHAGKFDLSSLEVFRLSRAHSIPFSENDDDFIYFASGEVRRDDQTMEYSKAHGIIALETNGRVRGPFEPDGETRSDFFEEGKTFDLDKMTTDVLQSFDYARTWLA